MRRVLVVEDYEDARHLIALVLEGAGYRVLSAADGLEGVELARKHRPDAIVMDLFMPIMDGVEATRRIKSFPETRDVPIIAYTARPATLAQDGVLFDAVCIKPCPLDNLLDTLRALLAGDWPGPSH
jgi:CheY-like chemotaxis protein